MSAMSEGRESFLTLLREAEFDGKIGKDSGLILFGKRKPFINN